MSVSIPFSILRSVNPYVNLARAYIVLKVPCNSGILRLLLFDYKLVNDNSKLSTQISSHYQVITRNKTEPDECQMRSRYRYPSFSWSGDIVNLVKKRVSGLLIPFLLPGCSIVTRFSRINCWLSKTISSDSMRKSYPMVLMVIQVRWPSAVERLPMLRVFSPLLPR